MLEFEWDSEKAKSNMSKHGVSFEEAKTVFYDDFARMFFDEDHSLDENRFILIGYSNKNRLLVVSFTERNNIVRIISTRKAQRNERKKHEEI